MLAHVEQPCKGPVIDVGHSHVRGLDGFRGESSKCEHLALARRGRARNRRKRQQLDVSSRGIVNFQLAFAVDALQGKLRNTSTWREKAVGLHEEM